MRLLLLALLLPACVGPDTTIGKTKVDEDGDGYGANVDCDDAHATVNPDAPELCDGLDNDCDGTVDEDPTDAPTWHADTDGDGFGDAGAPTTACEPPPDTVADATDCDDAEAAAFPGNAERCDELDNDCDGAVDDDPVDLQTVYQDADGDGYGDADTVDTVCAPEPGWVTRADDCDDADPARHPDATEDDCTDPVDYNCDGSVAYDDVDGDGTPACEDCDDADAARHPGATEVCDAADTDEDCDGLADDADGDVSGTTTWTRDVDGDGYAGAGASLSQCEPPTGYAAPLGDCDDLDAAANPGAAEVCDAANTDEDCDGLADDADPSVSSATWSTTWADRDGDTYGDAARPATQCDAPAGYVTNDDDCDDASASRNPAAAEVCDAANVDEDCDGLADDADASATGKTTRYRDADGDTYGDPASAAATCDGATGYVANDDDCDDATAARSPAATEVCDAADLDEDCDGLADDADTSVTGTTTWYRDADADGYGGATTTRACAMPTGYLATTTDCDDAHADAHPGGVETCDDGIDQDCSGADEGCPDESYDGSYPVDEGYDTKIYGHAAYDTFGEDIVGGDFDGDGVGDLVVGTTEDNLAGSLEGAVYGYYGPFPEGAHDARSIDDWAYYNNSGTYEGYYGADLANIGDVDLDGKDDLVVRSLPTGSLVYRGGDTLTTSATDADEAAFFCYDAAPGGQIDGTTTVGAWLCGAHTHSSNKGTVYVYEGWTSGTSGSTASLVGEVAGDYVGRSVAGGQDVDGDGYDDLLTGGDGNNSSAGAAYLVYTPVTSTFNLSGADEKITGNATHSQLGFWVDMGDMDGDGHADLVVAARIDDTAATDAGAIYVVTEPDSGTASSVASAVVTGEDAGDLAHIFDLGDFDGDGVLDLVVGSPENDDGGEWAGSVWLVYGPITGAISLATDRDAEWIDDGANDSLGYAVAAIPDTNGDGTDEIAMSAIWGDERGYLDRGAVWIWLGK